MNTPNFPAVARDIKAEAERLADERAAMLREWDARVKEKASYIRRDYLCISSISAADEIAHLVSPTNMEIAHLCIALYKSIRPNAYLQTHSAAMAGLVEIIEDMVGNGE